MATEQARLLSRPPLAKRRAGWRIAILAGAVLVAAELGLRALGLHTPVLFEATAYGYRPLPDQDVRRLGNRIAYNRHGLRSASVDALRQPGVVRVLCLGDSVTNGASHSDQAETYPAQLEALLRARGVRAEVLNASAPGWATANELGWLRDNGVLAATHLVLTLSTHDLFQPPAPSSVVGRHPGFPAQRPVLALQELVTRYILPKLDAAAGAADPGVGIFEPSAEAARANLDNVLAIARLAQAAGAHMAVILLDQDATEESEPLTGAAKRALADALDALGVGLIALRPALERHGRAALFRDDVHPNALGNRVIAEAVAQNLLPSLGVPSAR